MKFRSTRDKNIELSLSQAILQGLASDGGLFVPTEFPQFSIEQFDQAHTLQEIALILLKPFFKDDVLENDLNSIIHYALDFPIPFEKLNQTYVLELFHGPTGAFKDVGARFLAQCFEYLGESRTILVATSGDTGSAVASAFHGLQNSKVVILFPKGKISEFQEKQLTCWDGNILSLRVASDFDACQKFVKQAFNDPEFSIFNLSSANSINIGRLLPQMTYYATASIKFLRETGDPASFIIPTGNMGNALACIWIKAMGLPVDRIILSSNENDTIPIYIDTGNYEPKPSIPTLANAMDVGAPSNIERYFDLIKTFGNLVEHAEKVTNEQILTKIQEIYSSYDYLICPHTATAFSIHSNLSTKMIIVSTAHPSKFASIVEPQVDATIQVPGTLGKMIARPEKVTDIVNYDDLFTQLKQFLDL